jgi:hypothetical protein
VKNEKNSKNLDGVFVIVNIVATFAPVFDTSSDAKALNEGGNTEQL